VRVHRDITHQNMMIHTVDIFSLLGTGSGNGVEFLTGGYIHKHNWVKYWMNVFLHLEYIKCLLINPGEL
jgi:hypothetical protein